MYVFALAILLVYLCLAGQYESWVAPLAVILVGAARRSAVRPSRSPPSASPTTSTPRSA